MINSLTVREMELGGAIEQALVGGDLSSLTLPQRLEYYKAVCQSLKLNPLTKPFIYIELYDSQLKRKKLVLYPTGDCADQLRSIHSVSIDRLEKKMEDGIYEVTAYASLPNGRKDEATGFVFIGNLQGADKANAKMKAETKAKRRVTMSIVGLSGYAGIELNADETHYREVDVDTSPVITAREEQVKQERAARPVQEWVEELDEPTIEANNTPALFDAVLEHAHAMSAAGEIPNLSEMMVTRESYFAFATARGVNKEASKIANAHTKGKETDWTGAMIELRAIVGDVELIPA